MSMFDFSPDGQYFLKMSRSYTGMVTLYNLKTHKDIFHKSDVARAFFSANSKYLITIVMFYLPNEAHAKLVIYDLSSFEEVLNFPLEYVLNINPKMKYSVSKNGKYFVISMFPQIYQIFDACTFQLLHTIQHIIPHGARQQLGGACAGAIFSHDSNHLLTLNCGKLVVLETKTFQQVRILRGVVAQNVVVFSSDNKLCAAIILNGLRIWNASTYDEVATITTNSDHGQTLRNRETCLSFTPDNKYLLTTYENIIVIRDATTTSFQELAEISVPIHNHFEDINIYFSSNGTKIIFSIFDKLYSFSYSERRMKLIIMYSEAIPFVSLVYRFIYAICEYIRGIFRMITILIGVLFGIFGLVSQYK